MSPRRRRIALLAAFAAVLLAAEAGAAPVSRPAALTLSFDFLSGVTKITSASGFPQLCYGCALATVQATGSVTVDPMAGSIAIPPNLLQLLSPVSVGINGTTSVSSVTTLELTALTGNFSVGAAAGFAGEPACPLSIPGACVGQNGFGGTLGLAGEFAVTIIPGVVVLPFALEPLGAPGPGGITTGPLGAYQDGAPWTVGTARVRIGTHSSTIHGSVGSDQIRLVAPTFVSALGNTFAFTTSLEIVFTDGLGTPGFVSGTVPEPGLPWLALSGAAAAGWLAGRAPRRRRERRSPRRG